MKTFNIKFPNNDKRGNKIRKLQGNRTQQKQTTQTE